MKTSIATALGFTLIAASVSAAEIYIWSDQEGVRHFSDQPPSGKEREQIKGRVQSAPEKSQHVNVIQPYVAPVTDQEKSPDNSDQADASQKSDGADPATDAHPDANAETASSPQPEKQDSGRDTEDKSGNSARNSNRDELRSRSERLRDYDRQARIKEIKDRQKTPGLNPGDTPDTLNQKLKDYNNAKQQ